MVISQATLQSILDAHEKIKWREGQQSKFAP